MVNAPFKIPILGHGVSFKVEARPGCPVNISDGYHLLNI